MHNLGRGMWRRVGDFERIQVPQIIKHSQMEQALLYQQYIKKLQRQNHINQYRKQMLDKVNAQNKVDRDLFLSKDEPTILKQPNVEESIVEEQPVVEQPEVEQPNVEESIVEDQSLVEQPVVEQSIEEEQSIVKQPVVDYSSVPLLEGEKKPINLPKKGRKRR